MDEQNKFNLFKDLVYDAKINKEIASEKDVLNRRQLMMDLAHQANLISDRRTKEYRA